MSAPTHPTHPPVHPPIRTVAARDPAGRWTIHRDETRVAVRLSLDVGDHRAASVTVEKLLPAPPAAPPPDAGRVTYHLEPASGDAVGWPATAAVDDLASLADGLRALAILASQEWDRTVLAAGAARAARAAADSFLNRSLLCDPDTGALCDEQAAAVEAATGLRVDRSHDVVRTCQLRFLPPTARGCAPVDRFDDLLTEAVAVAEAVRDARGGSRKRVLVTNASIVGDWLGDQPDAAAVRAVLRRASAALGVPLDDPAELVVDAAARLRAARAAQVAVAPRVDPSPGDVLDFLAEVAEVCRRRGLSLSHEDEHGGFLVAPYDPGLAEWLAAARFAGPAAAGPAAARSDAAHPAGPPAPAPTEPRGGR